LPRESCAWCTGATSGGPVISTGYPSYAHTTSTPWHRDSVFDDGPRHPLCRERRVVWKARIDLFRRAGRVTNGEPYVGQALLKRLGQDGRWDPSHQQAYRT
jgi:hypothetical protein